MVGIYGWMSSGRLFRIPVLLVPSIFSPRHEGELNLTAVGGKEHARAIRRRLRLRLGVISASKCVTGTAKPGSVWSPVPTRTKSPDLIRGPVWFNFFLMWDFLTHALNYSAQFAIALFQLWDEHIFLSSADDFTFKSSVLIHANFCPVSVAGSLCMKLFPHWAWHATACRQKEWNVVKRKSTETQLASWRKGMLHMNTHIWPAVNI